MAAVTIAVSLKVNDGLVLATDSASTMSSSGGVENVYNNANKVYNLRKERVLVLVHNRGRGRASGLELGQCGRKERCRSTSAAARWRGSSVTSTVSTGSRTSAYLRRLDLRVHSRCRIAR